MSHFRRTQVLTFVVAQWIALTGCSPGLVGQSRELHREMLHVPPAVQAASKPIELGSQPTLDDYIAVALARNPRLAHARREAEATARTIAQQSSLPDPQLTLVPPTGDMTQTAAGEIDSAVGISQRIPFPAKLYERGRAAAHQAAAAREAYRAAELELITDVRRAYYMLYFADRAAALTLESRALLEDFRSIALRKYESGRVPQQDVLRAQLELANLEAELSRLHQARGTARARLNTLMAYPLDRPIVPLTPLALEAIALERQGLLELAAATNPNILAARQRIESARASQTLANLEHVPDLTLGYQYTNVSGSGLSPVANGDDTWSMNVGITLPIWFERLAAGRGEAAARLSASRHALADASNTVAFRVEEAMLRVDTEQRLVELFGDIIIPEARQTLEATVSAYRAGQVDFLTFIDNWRRLLDFRISYERSLSAYEQELAELERLVGGSLAVPTSAAAREDRS